MVELAVAVQNFVKFVEKYWLDSVVAAAAVVAWPDQIYFVMVGLLEQKHLVQLLLFVGALSVGQLGQIILVVVAEAVAWIELLVQINPAALAQVVERPE